MNRILATAALLAAGALPGLAEARPADCLVQIENRTRIDGTCEFEAEPNGDFSVTLGSRVARVMVDPGAREGRALYQDSASGEPPGVADVRRDGGCWGSPDAIRVCAWQPGQRPAALRTLPAAAAAPAAPAASSAPAGTRVVSSRQIGPWTLSRQEGGGRWRCEVERRYPDGGTLVFMAVKPSPANQNAADTGFRFGGPALQGMRGEISVRPWATDNIWSPVPALADGNGFATLMDAPNEPGSFDAFRDNRVLEIEVPGGARLRYPLDGSGAAANALAQCAGF